MKRPRFLPDNFTLILIATVVLASLLPVSGQAAVAFGWVTNLAIALLFFLHGAKLSRQAIVAGAGHWRLHLLVFSLTFVLFPLLGLALKPLLSPMIGKDLYMGMLYLCALPATVQSAIAFTSLARGNIPAAICSAAASSLFGIFLTPLLVALLLNVHGDGGSTVDAILKISVQLLLPFIAGQIARRWIGAWVGRNKNWLKFVDQGSILLVVYGAFSEAVNEGIWHQIPLWELGGLVVACCILLALVLMASALLGKAFGFNQEDRITILFCGSKKAWPPGCQWPRCCLPAAPWAC
jgi:solute carrier family 10 (sodium/bile acid cotransporter), member 7